MAAALQRAFRDSEARSGRSSRCPSTRRRQFLRRFTHHRFQRHQLQGVLSTCLTRSATSSPAPCRSRHVFAFETLTKSRHLPSRLLWRSVTRTLAAFEAAWNNWYMLRCVFLNAHCEVCEFHRARRSSEWTTASTRSMSSRAMDGST